MKPIYYLIENSLFDLDFLHSIFGVNIPDWVCSERPLPEYGVFKKNLEGKIDLKITLSNLSKPPIPKDKIHEILPIINNTSPDLKIGNTDSFHASLCYPKHPFWNLYMNKTNSLSLDKKETTKGTSWEHVRYMHIENRRLFFFCYKSWILGISSFLQKPNLIQMQDLSLFLPFENQSELLKMKFLEFAKSRFTKNQKIEITGNPDFYALYF